MLLCFVIGFFITSITGATVNITQHPNWGLLAHKTCGVSIGAYSKNRIVGGINATLGAYPWIARLGYSNSSAGTKLSFRCSATLINEIHVVTAAHCVMNLPENYVLSVVRLGEHNTLTDPDCDNDACAEPVHDSRVAKIIIHKEYSKPMFKNDISVIKLNKPVTYSEFVMPICMIQGDLLTMNLIGEKTEVAGWGFYDINNPKSSTILQTVKLPVVDLQKCITLYKVLQPTIHLDDRQLCVGGESGKDSCGGDSGGPMMKVYSLEKNVPRYYLIGIVSFGSRHCGQFGEPGVYTALSKYIHWILDVLSY